MSDKKRFVVHHCSEALLPQEPIQWIIENLFSEGSVSIIFGAGGSKKTYTLLDACTCVALGIPWLQFSTKEGTVLIIDEESGDRRMKQRLGEVMRAHKADKDTPIYYTVMSMTNLLDKRDMAELENLASEYNPKFILIDALADIMPGGDENSVKDTQPVCHGLRAIADKHKCAIVLIHHTNKAGTYRGSTALKGAVDLMMLVRSGKTSSKVEYLTEKARDIEPIDFTATVEWTNDKFIVKAAKSKPLDEKLSEAQEYVIRYLIENSDSRLMEIAGGTDKFSESTIRHACRELSQKGRIARVDKTGVGTSPAIYSIVTQMRGIMFGSRGNAVHTNDD